MKKIKLRRSVRRSLGRVVNRHKPGDVLPMDEKIKLATAFKRCTAILNPDRQEAIND